MSITGTLIEIGNETRECHRYIVIKEKGSFAQSALLRLRWPDSVGFPGKIGDTITVDFRVQTFTLRDGRFANTLDVCNYKIHDITDITPDEETIKEK